MTVLMLSDAYRVALVPSAEAPQGFNSPGNGALLLERRSAVTRPAEGGPHYHGDAGVRFLGWYGEQSRADVLELMHSLPSGALDLLWLASPPVAQLGTLGPSVQELAASHRWETNDDQGK